MTGGYHLLLPALWVCVLAFILSDRQSLYSSQLETRSRSPAHRAAIGRGLVDGVRVAQFLRPGAKVPSLVPGNGVETVLQRFAESRLGVLPVLGENGRLLGIVNLEDVLIATQAEAQLIVVADMMRTDLIPLVADDPLHVAQERFVESDVLALPVVRSADDQHVVGIVKRFDVASAYVQSIHGAKQASVAGAAGGGVEDARRTHRRGAES
jgi:CIC family chloride channel protein